ncbi:MAG TPA: TIM barrel protein [Pseudonocardia sp.]|uniref:hydroxypyruvate isomerase family protein n=1 Tax=Pseudonocardia sp. TaxID=60912 RepID=UPI002CE12A01|nr:TIM barrel protein [Pseudonocardia sp.]HTF50841.1 TIM barrel protein [Pseudonocardia sp.]
MVDRTAQPERTMGHTLSYAVNCSILFTELPLPRRPNAVRAAGFDAVEFWWPFPDAVPGDHEIDAFIGAIRDAGVALVGLNFAAGDMAGGDRGLVSWPARSAEFLDNVAVTVGIGAQLGTRAFNALYGNRVDGVAAEEQDELAVRNLAAAAAAAAEIDAVVLVEPVSGAPRYPLRHAADAITAADRVERATGATNVALLADLYHLTVNGDDVEAAIARYTDRVGHVQIADHPGRHEPGTGEIELDGQLTALQAGGYDGWVGLEYKPSTTSTQSVEWLPRARRAAQH